MPVEKRIYRVRSYSRIMTFLAVLLFGFASVASYFDGEQSVSVSCFVPLWLMSLLAFISSLYKIEVTETEISVTNFLRNKTLHWGDIANMTPKNDGYGFYLSNQGVDTKLLISNQIVGFLEIIEWIKYKRPDLLKREIPSTFHQVLLTFMVIGIFGLGTTLFSIYTLIDNVEDFWSKIFFLAIGLISLGSLLFIPREIALEGKNLVVHYFGRDRVIHVDDVSGISMERRMSNNVSVYPIQVRLKDGKKLTFGNVREGSQALMTALEQWLHTNRSAD